MSTPEFSSETGPSGKDSAGFFAALFDFEFKTFIALKFIKVIYIIALVLIGLAAVGVFFVSIAGGEFLTALATIVFLLFYLIAIRIWLEVIALLFRIGENTAAIRTRLEREG